ncbi:PAS domain S-box-containing protein [Duganella sp. CF458]|uniref:CHASE domain-containing protein n=1 Tax=Duganella sp. CF458 TaxID=1884368 RepID=UPI0008EF9741|nr:CHASE domain-containing protein [Duganella sp. CF458]SFG13024.1 PAS domain S-box-containing protein [Duganella sp. CF458]
MPYRLRTLTVLLLATGAYYLLARLGLMLALAQSNASPIWPPSGFALVLLLRYGRQFWPAILVGAFLANLAVFQNNNAASLPVLLTVSLAIAFGNAAEALIAHWLLQRLGIAGMGLQTQREVYKYGGVAAVAALSSALVGVLSLELSSIVPPALAWQVAATWWTGDFLGLLLLAPLAMAAPARPAWPHWAPGQLVFLASLVLATLAVFLSDAHFAAFQFLPYCLLFFLGLAAVNRWRSMVRIALAIISSIAIPATVMDHGPFVSGVLHHSLLSLSTYLAISSILAWVLATEEDPALAESYVWTPILILLACMTLTVGAWAWITYDTESRTSERFQRAADNVRETIRMRMEGYESLLRAGTALFDASVSVERDEWQQFVAGLDVQKQYPGVLGVGFARFAPAGAVAALNQELRVWPEGDRDLHAAIVYLEPRSERNNVALGYDMMSEPTRRDAMVAAMQSGKMTASGPITLVQEIEGRKQAGFLMFNPVYHQNAAGHRELHGFVYSPFRMVDLMHGIFGDALREVRLDVYFQDMKGQLMYTSARSGMGQSFTRLSSLQYVPVGDNGQTWALNVRPTAMFDTAVDQGKSFMLLLMGTLISLLFFGASRNLVHERIAALRAKEQSARQLEQQTASLEESEARFKLLTSHIRNHAIVLLDPAGTITTWNEGAQKLFGYASADIVGQPLQTLSTESHAVTSMKLALEHGQYESTSWRRRRDGSTFLGLKQLFPVRDEQGNCIGYAMIMRDVTAEKAAEKELNDAKTQAESASAAKSAFVANISHELRTPMNAVLGVSQILARTPLNAEQRQYLDMVSGAGRSLLALLNDVLDFSKIEANKLELADDDFLVEDVLSALAAVMAMTSTDKALALSLCVEADVPASLHGDVQRVQQVLLNLVSNALKFTERGTVSVHASRDPAQPGMLRWDVSDTGIGISTEQLQRLFSPFSQADASMARRYGGTGLGLTISQRLVQMMGGSIEVNSTPGRGTTFTFLMPLREGDLPDPYSAPGARRNWRVLYADPKQEQHDDVVQLAARWGWRCDTVDSAAGIGEALARANYDLLIYDRSLAASARRANIAQRICVRCGGQPPAADPGHDPELLRPLTRSALYYALSVQGGKAAAPAARSRAAAGAFSSGSKALEGLSILLAEDNALNQLVARSMLEAVGAKVHIAENGEQALSFLRSGRAPVDLVLMDVQMPVMDGFSATQAIRKELGQDLPVLAMSAGVTLGERAECEAVGMNGFVAKPVDGDDLITTILRFVHAKARN